MTEIRPDDESYWSTIRAQYTRSPDFINLENGYFGMPADPVRAALKRYQDEVDVENAFFLRTRWATRLAHVKALLAGFTGVAPDELLITRSAVESLNIVFQGYPFEAGDAIPKSTLGMPLALSGGASAKLADYDGRWLVLYFYPRDSTPGCTTEGLDFNALLPKFRKLGADVLGVSRDSLKSHDNFCAKQGFRFALVSDVEGKLAAYVPSTPDSISAVLVESNGTALSLYPAGFDEPGLLRDMLKVIK